MGATFHFAGCTLAIGFHHAGRARLKARFAQDLLLIWKMARNIFAVGDRVFEHGMLAPGQWLERRENGGETQSNTMHPAPPVGHFGCAEGGNYRGPGLTAR